MEKENRNGHTPEEQYTDWMPDLETGEISEADQAAQAWLEQLLATTAPGATVPETAPEEPAVEDTPLETEESEPVPQEPEWFLELEAPAEQVQQIGTDEHAVSQHDMTELADMELDKIMQEAMSDEWDIAAIEHEILSQSSEEVFPGDPDSDENGMAVYTDDGGEMEEEDIIDSNRKVRPKRKNGYGLFGLPHLASMAIWAALCITIGISLGRVLWLCAADILAFGRQDEDVVITITESDTLDSVTNKLYNAGLIQYRDLFKFYAGIAGVEVGADGKISTGTFTLNTLYDYHALVKGMNSTSSYRQTITVTIPEGYTCAQIFALLEEEGVCSTADLENYCTQSEFSSYWFLEDVEKGTKYCLEGFLFPDTYEFYTNSSAKLVFITLLNGFSNHFTEDMKFQLDTLNALLESKYAANGASANYVPLSVKDIITVASMIEKETAYSGESPTIASVIYNRLTNPGEYPYLNIDATVVYALGGKTDLTTDDLKVDSPYNTYVIKGLPAGPISNPGANSLKAALNPENTGYYFYSLDTDEGIHKFFKTYKEHQEFLASQR